MRCNHSRYIKVCYIENEMKTRATNKNTIKNKKNRKKIRVLAQGTFDLLHPGHVHYLNTAKSAGDHLTVIVARDTTVKRVKKRDTVFPEKMRVEMVRALKMVDRAVLGGKGNMLDKVIEIRPHVIVVGYDQHVSIPKLKHELAERGLVCSIVRAGPHAPHAYKSTKLKNKIYQKMST